MSKRNGNQISCVLCCFQWHSSWRYLMETKFLYALVYPFVFSNISENFIFKPHDCNLGTIINHGIYLGTLLLSSSSSKLNFPSHPTESFFSTSNDSERVMHNKHMIHRQLFSLLSNISLICYLVNIVTLKIQRLNQWISLPFSRIWNTQSVIDCCYPWNGYLWLEYIYTWTIIKQMYKEC